MSIITNASLVCEALLFLIWELFVVLFVLGIVALLVALVSASAPVISRAAEHFVYIDNKFYFAYNALPSIDVPTKLNIDLYPHVHYSYLTEGHGELYIKYGSSSNKAVKKVLCVEYTGFVQQLKNSLTSAAADTLVSTFADPLIGLAQ